MLDDAFEALKFAIVQHINWLRAEADDLGKVKADNFLHEANNLEAVVIAYERMATRRR